MGDACIAIAVFAEAGAGAGRGELALEVAAVFASLTRAVAADQAETQIAAAIEMPALVDEDAEYHPVRRQQMFVLIPT